MITIIAPGKKTDYDTQIADYIKRLRSPFNLQIKAIGYADKDAESTAIIAQIDRLEAKCKQFVVLLDERGENIDNQAFLSTINSCNEYSQGVVFIIGGAYGVNDAVKQRADKTIALGKLVLPHQIVRLVLVEQVYRAYTIANGHPYHHA